MLFTSGYTQNAIVHGGRLDPGVSLISKPYTQKQLARRVRHMLSNRQHRVAAQHHVPGRHKEYPAAGGLRVLVVENVPESRHLACDMLVELGYKAMGVTDPETALALLDKEGFDILFADYSLPKMNGMEMAKIAKVGQPALKVIFASGYGEVFEQTPQFKYVALPKPFDIGSLAEALELVRVLSDATAS